MTAAAKQLLALLSLVAWAVPVQADHYSVPKNALFEEECASCHLAFPPQMLDVNSWRAMMNDLTKHFGTDASLDEKRRLAIADFLSSNAGGRKTGVTIDAAGKPLLRITQTERFIRKHREVSPAVYQRASIKTPANCTACHVNAAAGDYEERGVRIPR